MPGKYNTALTDVLVEPVKARVKLKKI